MRRPLYRRALLKGLERATDPCRALVGTPRAWMLQGEVPHGIP